MMQIFCEGLELSSSQFLLVLFCFICLHFSKFFKFFSELFVFLSQLLEFFLAHVEVVNEFSYEVTSEDFLYKHCLLCKITKTFCVEVCSFIVAVDFASVEGPEMSLYLGCGCLFRQKLFALDVHLELGLNLEGSCIIASPLFFALVGPQIVDLLYCAYQVFFLRRQFHQSIQSNSYSDNPKKSLAGKDFDQRNQSWLS